MKIKSNLRAGSGGDSGVGKNRKSDDPAPAPYVPPVYTPPPYVPPVSRCVGI